MRRRAQGLIRKNEPCFLWNGSDWSCICDDNQVIVQHEGEILKIKVLPLTGCQFKVSSKPTKKSEALSSYSGSEEKSTVRSSSLAPTFLSSGFDSRSTEKVLNDMAESAKKMSSLMGATLSSLAKTATETVKVVNDATTERRLEQVGSIKLRIGKKVAEGGFSEVYIAKGSQNEAYALKKCRAQTEEQLQHLKQEISAHQKVIDSEYILKLYASDISSTERGSIVRFVFPFCDGGSWHQVLDKSEEEHLQIFLGAAKGLKFLHEKKILHRDVKPHNILLTREGHPLLMDLGSSCALPIVVNSKGSAALLAEEAAEHCSAPYRAPELWEPKVGKNIGGEADVWSLGCSLFATTCGRGYSPYEDAIQGVLKLAILNGSPLKFPQSSRICDLTQTLILESVNSGSRLDLDTLIDRVERYLQHG